ncbi:MAG TPA: LytR C-terminal domain-containing protein [Acidimicrobiia bacterium]|jgi:hypothetical protein|nr:LytR C-terminal domain-containing protein [Acidimicrobiia bacterium]
MNRPSSGSSGSDVARGAGFAAAKGVLLIGLAVVIGIVLLQQVDHDSNSSAATTQTTAKPKTTTTVATATTTTSAPTSTEPAKAPEDVHIIVLNGGGVTGAALTMRTQLLQAHYTNSDTQNNWSGHTQTGNTVLCKSGMEREAVALAVAVGEGTQTPPFPTPAPPYSDNVDCVVVVGASSSSSSGGTANTSTVTTAAAG